MTINFGQPATLESGQSCTVLDADDVAGVFVKVETPVQLVCGGHGPLKGQPIGMGDKFWVPLNGWGIRRDKDGVKCGIEI